MIHFHIAVGLLVLLVFIVSSVRAILSLTSGKTAAVPKGLRRVAVSLLDLQILIGIVTFVLHARWGTFLLHPLLMLVAVALVHMLTSDRRSVRLQTAGFVGGTVLMGIGALIQ